MVAAVIAPPPGSFSTEGCLVARGLHDNCAVELTGKASITLTTAITERSPLRHDRNQRLNLCQAGGGDDAQFAGCAQSVNRRAFAAAPEERGLQQRRGCLLLRPIGTKRIIFRITASLIASA